jgi:hypothetical protein
VICRLPWHADGFAVFQGFSLDDDDRIDLDDRKMKELKKFLKSIKKKLQEDLLNDATDESCDTPEEYMVQNVPAVSIGSAAIDYARRNPTT